MLLREWVESTGDQELIDYFDKPAPENNHGEGSGEIFKKVNYATYQHVRRMLLKIHSTYADWPLSDRQIDMMIDSIGAETIEKLAERARQDLN